RAPRYLRIQHGSRPRISCRGRGAPLIGGSLAVVALIASLAIYQGMAAIAGCAWNSWMRDLVPSAQYGRFFGRRTAVTTALSVAVALGGGVLIDLWKDY